MTERPQFGQGDTSYKCAGEEPGLRRLVTDFYYFMDTLPEAKKIRAMHPEDLDIIIDKLTLFLCGWLGGPRLFQQKYGPIHIPRFHMKFPIAADERDAWLHCMKRALERQDYLPEFKEYLMKQLFVPAERIRVVQELHAAEAE